MASKPRVLHLCQTHFVNRISRNSQKKKKTHVKDKSYKVQFVKEFQGEKLKEIHNLLHMIFDDVLHHVRTGVGLDWFVIQFFNLWSWYHYWNGRRLTWTDNYDITKVLIVIIRRHHHRLHDRRHLIYFNDKDCWILTDFISIWFLIFIDKKKTTFWLIR